MSAPREEKERRSRLEALLLEGLDLPTAERAEFAARQCADDADLHRELLDLLGCDSESALPSHDAPSSDRITIDERRLRVPGYRIESVLGSGGMGIVYRAIQERLDRPVALKLLHGIDPDLQRAGRLEREAELLARLQHPGIAQIHETGLVETDVGSMPWFAMELVDGRDPLVWARETNASLHARIHLCIDLCEAVQHAHDRGVIHRDLKPGNVLVVTDSSHHAQPKILDFGIARDAQIDGDTEAALTRTGHFVGTVPYMSPEQLRGANDLDARADVYALGVLLYQLLTGHLPLELSGRSLTESIRTILDEDPARLGTHDRALRGDLEIICQVALEKDRNRRYLTARALADDLRRYLADEPIIARPPSRWTRIRRFSRRNRTLVAVALTVLVALGSALAAALQIARDNALRAATERDLRGRADDAAEAARRNLYFAQMAATSLADDETGIAAMARQLEHWIPEPGATDHRGWEWFAMHGLADSPEHVLGMRSFIMHIAAVPETQNVLVCGDGFCRELDLETFQHRELPEAPGSKNRAVVPSRDGKLAAAAGSGGVTVWRLQDLEVLARIELPDWGSNIAFHPDGDHLAVLTFLKGLLVFDWRSGEVVHRSPDEHTIHGDAMQIDFSPDGRFLALSKRSGNVLVLDAADWSVHADLPSPDTVTQALRFSHDGRSLATGHGDGSIQVLDVETWRRRQHLQSHQHWVTALSWSPDDRELLSSSNDRTVRIWSAAAGHAIRIVDRHDGNADAAEFSADGRFALSGGRNRALHIRALDRPVARAQLGPAYRFTAPHSTDLHWRDEDHLLLVHKELRQTWRVSDGECTATSTALGPGRFSGSPDGRWFAGSDSDQRASIWSQTDDSDRRTSTALRLADQFPTWSHDSARVAFTFAGEVWMWRLEEPEPTLWFRGEGTCRSTAWDAHGSTLAVRWHDRISLHRGDDGTEFHRWPAPGPTSRFGRESFALDASSGRVAVSERDGRILVWSPDEAEPLELAGHDQEVGGLHWQAGGQRLVSCSMDRTIKVWDPVLGQLAGTFRLDHAVVKAVWSPSGRRLAAVTGAGDLHVWDAGPGYALEERRLASAQSNDPEARSVTPPRETSSSRQR